MVLLNHCRLTYSIDWILLESTCIEYRKKVWCPCKNVWKHEPICTLDVFDQFSLTSAISFELIVELLLRFPCRPQKIAKSRNAFNTFNNVSFQWKSGFRWVKTTVCFPTIHQTFLYIYKSIKHLPPIPRQG